MLRSALRSVRRFVFAICFVFFEIQCYGTYLAFRFRSLFLLIGFQLFPLLILELIGVMLCYVISFMNEVNRLLGILISYSQIVIFFIIPIILNSTQSHRCNVDS